MVRRLGICGLSVLVLFVLACQVQADGGTLKWDAPTSGGEVAGYEVHYGESSSNLNKSIDVGLATECPLSDLETQDNTTYYIAVRAYNSNRQYGPFTEPPLPWASSDSTPPDPPWGMAAE